MKSGTVNIFLRTRGLFVFFVLVVVLLPASLFSREITDMAGEHVVVPDKITRVYSMNITVEYMVYAIDPSLLVARTGRMSGNRFFRKQYQELPVVGGAFGNGLNVNQEALLAVKPDVILVWKDDGAYGKAELGEIQELGIPVVAVDVNSLLTYPATFEFLGKLLGREKRAAVLSAYTRGVLGDLRQSVSHIPAKRRLSVYSAGGEDGLNSACEASWHSESVRLAGGRNPVQCINKGFTGFQSLSSEQLVALNPDVIVSRNPKFASSLEQDSRWADIHAVKTKRIYYTPAQPLNWLDGPPSLMQILGVQWLAKNVYPDVYKKDIEKETQKFIQIFFGVQLTPQETMEVLKSGYNTPFAGGGMGGGHFGPSSNVMH